MPRLMVRFQRVVLLLAGTVVFGVMAAACVGSDSAGPETGADMDDVTEGDVFGENGYVGTQVTVSAEVTDVINPTSFVMGGGEYDPLLVLYDKAEKLVRSGEVVRVTGTVREFHYADYADTYSLAAQRQFVDFESEEFLVADSIQVGIGSEGSTEGR